MRAVHGHELEVPLDAVLAGLPLARALVRGGGEGGIAAAAAPALRHEDRITRRERLAQERPRVGIPHLGPGWRGQGEIGTRLPRHVLSLAVLAALRLPLGAVAVVEQRAEVRIGAHVHAPALPPVAAIGATLGDEFFAAERRSTGAACTADDVDDCAVYEHCGLRIADWGLARLAPRPIRAVRMDATVIASSSPASRDNGASRAVGARRHSSRSSSQKAVSSVSSSTMPIFAMKSLRDRARHADR